MISVRLTAVSFLVHPSSLGRRSFSVLFKPHRLAVILSDATDWAQKHTEEVGDQLLLDRGILQSPKDDERGSHLAEAELLRGRRERVVGVVGPRGDLPRQLAVGDLLRREDVGGPVDGGGVEDGLVEDVVVAEEGIGAAGGCSVSGRPVRDLVLCACLPQAGIVFQDVVAVEIVPVQSQNLIPVMRTIQDVLQSEECCVGLGVGNHGLVPHYTGQLGIKVDASTQGMDRIFSGDVSTVTGEEAVIGKSVHHRARPTNYMVSVDHGRRKGLPPLGSQSSAPPARHSPSGRVSAPFCGRAEARRHSWTAEKIESFMVFYNFFSFWLWIVLIRRKRTNAFLGWILKCFLSDPEQEPFLYTS